MRNDTRKNCVRYVRRFKIEKVKFNNLFGKIALLKVGFKSQHSSVRRISFNEDEREGERNGKKDSGNKHRS